MSKESRQRARELKGQAYNTTFFVPCTPAGTPCTWLAATGKQQAINNLLRDAAHMPYQGWEGFQQRGYTIEEWQHDPR